MSATADRRRTIRVQDLLCHNATDASPCRSPSNATDRTTAALSSSAFSYGHYARNYSRSSSLDLEAACSSDLDVWHQTSADSFRNHVAERPSRTSNHLINASATYPHTSDNSDHRQKAVRGPWRIEEDRLLIELVEKYGARHWSAIATHFPRRSGKQARERWMNQLNPDLKKKNWTADEDRVILRAHATLGNKWSAIANLLPGRTDNSVKNRFNSTLKRAMKERSLTTQSLNIDEFVQTLHAKPYILGQDFLLSADHGIGSSMSKHGSSSHSMDRHSHLNRHGISGMDLDGTNYLGRSASGVGGHWGGSSRTTHHGLGMRSRADNPFGHGYSGRSPGHVSSSGGDRRSMGSLVTDHGRTDYREGSPAVCRMHGSGRDEFGRATHAGVGRSGTSGRARRSGHSKDDFCPIRDSLGGRREVSPEKSISKRRH